MNLSKEEFFKEYPDGCIKLSQYLALMQTFNLDEFPQLKIEVDLDYNFGENGEHIIRLLNGKNNISSLIISPADLARMDPNGLLALPITLIINDASKLSLELLENIQQRVASVRILYFLSGEYIYDETDEYSLEEYKQIRKKINKILSMIHDPGDGNPNREKIIFGQIYRILGTTIEKMDDRILQDTCGRLGALIYGINGNHACIEYSEILRNVLACVGIESEIHYAFNQEILHLIVNQELYNSSFDGDGAHAFNYVKLDGEDYWCDLTWDVPYIKANIYPLPHCFKSTDDFFSIPINYACCKRSLSAEEQKLWFEPITPEIKYLGDFALHVANQGLPLTELTKFADTLKQVRDKKNAHGRGRE